MEGPAKASRPCFIWHGNAAYPILPESTTFSRFQRSSVLPVHLTRRSRIKNISGSVLWVSITTTTRLRRSAAVVRFEVGAGGSSARSLRRSRRLTLAQAMYVFLNYRTKIQFRPRPTPPP
jgi:hypothetical protein